MEKKPDFSDLMSLVVETKRLNIRITDGLGLSKEGNQVSVYTKVPLKGLMSLPWQPGEYKTAEDAVEDREGNVTITGYIPMKMAKAMFDRIGGVAENAVNGVLYAVEVSGWSAYSVPDKTGVRIPKFKWADMRILGYTGDCELRKFDDVVAELLEDRKREEEAAKKTSNGGDDE